MLLMCLFVGLKKDTGHENVKILTNLIIHAVYCVGILKINMLMNESIN